MGESYGSRAGGASAREAMRLLAAQSGWRTGDPAGTPPSLESLDPGRPDPPRVDAADTLEPGAFRARPVGGVPVAAFGAFLDGIQRSVVIGHSDAGVPVVHGTVAAAIRERRDRALHRWGDSPIVRRAVFLPVARVGRLPDALAAVGVDVVDTGLPAEGVAHPQEALGAARRAVQQRREAAEAALARAWCASEARPLYVDGGTGAFDDAARSPLAIGVVKSHHTLYVPGEGSGVAVLSSLAPGERTTAVLVSTRQRARVASWYLRLRAGDGLDPLAGIVRVEVAEGGFDSARADEVSRWVLAEREPAALPDARWRVMAYGIRDCEEYLRAVAG